MANCILGTVHRFSIEKEYKDTKGIEISPPFKNFKIVQKNIDGTINTVIIHEHSAKRLKEIYDILCLKSDDHE